MSTLVRNVPLPVLKISADRWFTETYESEDSCFDIPLFRLALVEEERSTISCHFPSLFFFDIIPSGLMWIAGC